MKDTHLWTLKFDETGQISRIIHLKNNDHFEIVENDDSVINHPGKYIPEHFGKFIDFGNDSLELFPLSIENDPMTGNVPCLCIHRNSKGEQNDISIICPINDGESNKIITLFWNDDKLQAIIE